MFARILSILLIAACTAWTTTATAQGEKKVSGSTVGMVQGQKNTPDGKNTFIEVLAPGEEKARAYHVLYDAKRKGPNPHILEAVRAAKSGDRVELEWVQTGHGPALTSFRVTRKATDAPKM